MPFQLLDIILAGIMIISGLLALMRGFTREVLSLVAWLAAAIAAYLALKSPQLLELANKYIQPEIVAKIALAGVVFLIVLVIVSLISVKLADFVLDSAAGAFDRSLGLVYGLARGLVLVVVAYLFYGWLTPADRQEDWIKNARSLPLIKSTGDIILSFVPPDIEQMLKNSSIIGNQAPIANTGTGTTTTTGDSGTKPAQTTGDQPAGDATQDPGYQKSQTQGLDQLIQGSQGTTTDPPPADGEQPAFGGQGNQN
jgi:membrane protein required for colicin V production